MAVTCLEKEVPFSNCTKVPYGLVGVLEVNLGKAPEQSLREPPTLPGRVEKEEPPQETLRSG